MDGECFETVVSLMAPRYGESEERLNFLIWRMGLWLAKRKPVPPVRINAFVDELRKYQAKFSLCHPMYFLLQRIILRSYSLDPKNIIERYQEDMEWYWFRKNDTKTFPLIRCGFVRVPTQGEKQCHK